MLKFDTPNEQRLAQEKIYDQMRDLGYTSHNSMLVLGSITIFITYWVVKVVFYIILKLATICMFCNPFPKM